MPNFNKEFGPSTRAALQFSGGKDSLATLLLLRPYWDRLTVYWLSTGDNFPETHELMQKVRELVPHFVEVESSAPVVREVRGWPVDVLPVRNTDVGQLYEAADLKLQSRYECCWKVIQLPMHQRMLRDGINLIIRGQKNADGLKGPLHSGENINGMRVLYPIETWTDKQVLDFIEAEGWQIPRFYETMPATPDCMGCTAYLHENKGAYLRKHYPEEFREWRAKLLRIKNATDRALAPLNKEF